MTAPDQCCINVKKLLSISRRPHMTHSCQSRMNFAVVHNGNRPAAPDVECETAPGDFKAHAEALQPCRKSQGQVVQPPGGNPGCGVEGRLRFRPAAKGVPRSPGKTSANFASWCAPWRCELRSWSAWQVSSRSPENAERSNLH